jgi:hypothetical protein
MMAAPSPGRAAPVRLPVIPGQAGVVDGMLPASREVRFHAAGQRAIWFHVT